MSTASRVIKNTSYLYLKMGITTFVTLYSTRLVLASLGASDFGVFHIVGGVISMLGFLNLAAANATYRFLACAEEENDLEKKKTVFNASLVLHVFIAMVTALLLLVAMYPLFNGILNIDVERIGAARVVYASLIFSAILAIINVPYDAILNVHENMLYYSLIGVFEAVLRLGIAIACVYTHYDKLIFFGVLSACVPIITLSITKLYCHRHYEECVIAPAKYWDFQCVKKMSAFSGWTFLITISELVTFQGTGVVLNHFFGTVLNAAQGISNQVKAYLSTFSENMKKALISVIMKKASGTEYGSLNATSISSSKFFALMTLFFAVPFILEAPYILNLWLTEVPQWTVVFCIFQLAMTIMVQMTKPLEISIYGVGDIKEFAIWKSIMNISPLIFTYICFRNGGSPIWLYIPMIIVWAFCGNIVVVAYAKRFCKLSIDEYMKNVVLPVVTITMSMFALGVCVHISMSEGLLRLVLCFMATTIGMIASLILVGLSSEEKRVCNDIVKNIIERVKQVKR